ncbi:MAG: type II toxin-antitoxin system VapC family toxin [Anaerolineales bacterium]
MARRVVMDANLTLALFLRLPYSEQAHRWMQRRREHEDDLYVPILWEYECMSGLQRAVVAGLIGLEEAMNLAADLLALEPQRVAPTLSLHREALRWAERLGQGGAYDAQYVAVATQLNAEFWSADRRLISALREQGAGWAHWIGEV